MWEGSWVTRTFRADVQKTLKPIVWEPEDYDDIIDGAGLLLALVAIVSFFGVGAFISVPSLADQYPLLMWASALGFVGPLLLSIPGGLLWVCKVWWWVTHKPLAWVAPRVETTTYYVEEHHTPVCLELCTEPEPLIRGALDPSKQAIKIEKLVPDQAFAEALVQLAASRSLEEVEIKLSPTVCVVELSRDPKDKKQFVFELRDRKNGARLCVEASAEDLTAANLSLGNVPVLKKFGVQMEREALESFLSEVVHLLKLQGVRLPRALHAIKEDAT